MKLIILRHQHRTRGGHLESQRPALLGERGRSKTPVVYQEEGHVRVAALSDDEVARYTRDYPHNKPTVKQAARRWLRLGRRGSITKQARQLLREV